MKVVAVYSTKGGVGKTTTAVNLAREASRRHRVVLWDLDPQGAATYLLGVKPKLKGGIDALVAGTTEAADSVRATAYERLAVLPADASYRELDLVLDAAKKSTRRVEKILASLGRAYDVVILDCPPGASLVAENAVQAADVVVVPLVPSPLALRSLDQVREVVGASRTTPPIRAFLSMVDRRKAVHRQSITELVSGRKELLDIVVPASVVVERMGSERAPVAEFAPSTDAAKAYREIWSRLERLLKPGR